MIVEYSTELSFLLSGLMISVDVTVSLAGLREVDAAVVKLKMLMDSVEVWTCVELQDKQSRKPTPSLNSYVYLLLKCL